MDIEYQLGGPELLDRAASLWEDLREFHARLDPQRAAMTRSRAWEERRSDLLAKSGSGQMLIELAIYGDALIAYCIATIDDKQKGEIDSLYVSEEWRGRGIGRHLLITSLDWLKTRGTTIQQLAVREGNEKALTFYQRCGFVPLMRILIHHSE
ncbi:MAG: GNAT family N-acetyltransferase [Syntrophomonas sp.]